MAKLYGKNYTKDELLKRVGDISQIAEARSVELQNGNEAGLRAIEFRTGSGFNFTVLADRGMDISSCDYSGQSLSWQSSTGNVAPEFYEPEGLKWLRTFYGGLVCTCGVTYAGAPCVDEGEELGLHGRFSHIPAKNVCVDSEWQGDDYVIWAQGKIRETRVFGENIVVTRKIWTKLGENRFWLRDIVENIGFDTVPHMMLYHINGGFPAVDADSELLSPTLSAKPRDTEAEVEKELYNKFPAPSVGFKERVYYHDMATDNEGAVYTALVNKNFNNGQGFGFYVKYIKSQLPRFIEWKMNCAGTYVVGMEPANCLVEGRDKDRARGILQFLQPGEKREYELEIGALPSNNEIAELEERIRKIRP
ncbi:MAG: aldose 1-epimerase family protein [Armatimonadota bacterium]|nr:aldose 1-epimerase family protein [Armatimonadota bacterium]